MNGARILLLILLMFFSLTIGCAIEAPETAEKEGDEGGLPVNSENNRPVAHAGMDQILLITDASEIVLDGTGSEDPDGDALTYLWRPVDGAVSFDPDNRRPTPSLSLSSSGEFYFILSVNDGRMDSEPDIVKITVVEPDAWVDGDLSADIPEAFRFKTIQQAIDAVADGTEKIIVVEEGLYTEKVSLEKNIYLFGRSTMENDFPKIACSLAESEREGAVITLESNATLENFHVYCEASPGGDIEGSVVRIGESSNGSTVSNCRISQTENQRNAYIDGITLGRNASLGTILNTAVEDVSGEGIVIKEGASVCIKNTFLKRSAGSSVWGIKSRSIVIEKSLIYQAGYHGIDLYECENATINHCTIADFAGVDDSQCGLKISGGGAAEIKNTLIVVKPLPTLSGFSFNSYSGTTNLSCSHNYIYSAQPTPKYYTGDITMEPVDPLTAPFTHAVDGTNHPNGTISRTADPELRSPETDQFSLSPGSPAAGLAENGLNPGI